MPTFKDIIIASLATGLGAMGCSLETTEQQLDPAEDPTLGKQIDGPRTLVEANTHVCNSHRFFPTASSPPRGEIAASVEYRTASPRDSAADAPFAGHIKNHVNSGGRVFLYSDRDFSADSGTPVTCAGTDFSPFRLEMAAEAISRLFAHKSAFQAYPAKYVFELVAPARGGR